MLLRWAPAWYRSARGLSGHSRAIVPERQLTRRRPSRSGRRVRFVNQDGHAHAHEVVRVAGHDRRSLRPRDAIIAGVAWSQGATVVTRNPDDFVRMGVP